jgi:hypothetical protein
MRATITKHARTRPMTNALARTLGLKLGHSSLDEMGTVDMAELANLLRDELRQRATAALIEQELEMGVSAALTKRKDLR